MKSGKILKRLIASRPLRVALCIFFVLNTVLLIASGQVFVYFQDNHFYEDSGAELLNTIESALLEKYSYDAIRLIGLRVAKIYDQNNIFLQSDDIKKEYIALSKKLDASNTNFRYVCASDKQKYSNQPEESNSAALESSSKIQLSESKQKTIFENERNIAKVIFNADDWTFNGYVLKDMKANDDFLRLDASFQLANRFKIPLAILLAIFAVLEAVLMYYICRVAGRAGNSEHLEIGALDRVPLYLVLLLYLPAFVLATRYLKPNFSTILFPVNKLAQWSFYSTKVDVRPSLLIYTALLVLIALLTLTFFQTISVRFKETSQKTGKGNDFRAKASLALLVLTAAQIIIIPLIYIFWPTNLQLWAYLLSEVGFTIVLTMLIYLTGKDISSILLGTHRIAFRNRGTISTDGLSGQFRTHVENINFLSHAASAETEKRFVNESFSTKLINGISDSLREPLSAVSATIDQLETGTLTPTQEKTCVQALNVLSQNLKKTIEDLIRISKATTGDLKSDIRATDAGMLLEQFAGEYSGMFSRKGIRLTVSHPDEPVLFNADGQFMWYIFDGIFKLLLEKVVPGTRVFMTMKSVKETVLILFHCCVDAENENEEAVFNAKSGLGLPTAKVFTELQGGTIRYACRQDMLNIALRFPQTAKEETPTENE